MQYITEGAIAKARPALEKTDQNFRRTYQSGLDADLAKTVLEAAGIESTVRGDDTYYPGLSLTQGVELLVRSQDAEDADKILHIDPIDGDNPE